MNMFKKTLLSLGIMFGLTTLVSLVAAATGSTVTEVQVEITEGVVNI